MELIILCLGGSIGGVLSQLLEIITEWHLGTHPRLSPPPGADHQGNAELQAEPQAAALRRRVTVVDLPRMSGRRVPGPVPEACAEAEEPR